MQTFPRLVAIALSAAPLSAAQAAATPAEIIQLPLSPVVAPSLRECTTRTPSGLGYRELRAGAGGKPTKQDVVLVNYIGYLAATGASFDQGMSGAFSVSEVIPGFSEGLQLMAKGSVYRICVPAMLGYGGVAQGPIPANSELVFQVEMIDFKSLEEIRAAQKAAEASQDAAQQAAPPPAK